MSVYIASKEILGMEDKKKNNLRISSRWCLSHPPFLRGPVLCQRQILPRLVWPWPKILAFPFLGPGHECRGDSHKVRALTGQFQTWGTNWNAWDQAGASVHKINVRRSTKEKKKLAFPMIRHPFFLSLRTPRSAAAPGYLQTDWSQTALSIGDLLECKGSRTTKQLKRHPYISRGVR